MTRDVAVDGEVVVALGVIVWRVAQGTLTLSAQGGRAERRRGADLGVGSLPGHGRLHLHVAALWRTEGQAGQVFDGGVGVLTVQRTAAHRRRVLQLFAVIFSKAGAVTVAAIDSKCS